MTRLALATLLALGIAALAAIRLWPVPQTWHEDPATVTPPSRPNHWLIRDGADAPALRLRLPPEVVAAKLVAIAGATPRTRLLAGEGLHKTWLTRSRLLGYPDTTSVLIRPDGTGSEVLIFARSRFGGSDFGVSRTRVETWAAALTAP